MADVQLEHGHVRLANRLAEAMLDAEFSGIQFKILHTLIRLTYGWRRRTVTLTQAELAAYMHTSASGAFRAALNELIAEGVVIHADVGKGGKRSTYAIEKDFTRWGRFGVNEGRLERIYGERPACDDKALFQADLLTGPSPETGESENAPPENSRPNQSQALARISHKLSPESGAPEPPKSLPVPDVAPPKDNNKQGKTSTVVITDAVVRLVVAANQGLEEHPDHPQAIPSILPMQPGSMEATRDIEAAGVPLEFAERALYEAAKSHRAGKSVSSLKYFTAAVIQAWERERAARAMAADRPAPRRATVSAADADAAWFAVLKLMPAWHRKEITAGRQRELSAATRAGLSAVGGFARIAETSDSDRGFLKKRFTAAYRATPTTLAEAANG